MLDKFKYHAVVNRKYEYLKDRQLSVLTYSHDFGEIEVSAYAFSNVDTFGAQVLCYQHANLSTTIYNELKLCTDFSYISAAVVEDCRSIGNDGWLSLNTRYLKQI